MAMILALFVAFWLQLDGASSAGVCVGILALPTRGKSLQKGVYRMLGTLIGVVASYVIVGLFNQQREMFFTACGIWLGLCVYAAGMFDGNRAYGAVLSGYTVAIVAVGEIDSPMMTFSSGVNRGAAEAIGILSIAFISDVFRAPDLYPGLVRRVETIYRKTRAFAASALRDRGYDPVKLAALLGEVTALHPDITTLPSESVAGRSRAAAANAAVASMTRELSAARAVTATLARLGSGGQRRVESLADAVEGAEAAMHQARARIGAVLHEPDAEADRLVAACGSLVMLDQTCEGAEAIAAMRADRAPPCAAGRGLALPLYRSHESARRDGFRVFLVVAISAFLFTLAGWPATSGGMLRVIALTGISATNPDPKGFAQGALIAMPLAVVASGTTEFLILDGASDFPTLALGMLPTVLVASFLMASGRPRLLSVGFLLLVYFAVLLSPANPQSYDVQSFLTNSALSMIAVVFLAIILSTLLPTDDAMRRRWLMRSARDDLRRVLRGRTGGLGIQAASYRDADRLAQLHGYKDKTGDDATIDLRRCMYLADLSLAARRIHAAFAALRNAGDRAPAGAASALAALNAAGLRAAAADLLDHRGTGRRAAAELLFAASLIEAHEADFSGVARGRPA